MCVYCIICTRECLCTSAYIYVWYICHTHYIYILYIYTYIYVCVCIYLYTLKKRKTKQKTNAKYVSTKCNSTWCVMIFLKANFMPPPPPPLCPIVLPTPLIHAPAWVTPVCPPHVCAGTYVFTQTHTLVRVQLCMCVSKGCAKWKHEKKRKQKKINLWAFSK